MELGARTRGLLAVVLTVASAACGTGQSGNGGSSPASPDGVQGGGGKVGARDVSIVLKVGNNDFPTGAGALYLAQFAAEVDRRSDGRVKVEPVDIPGVGVLQFSQRLAEMVKDGELDLALVPTRAFDELGVTSLQALQAPFLLSDDDAIDKVVTGPLAEDLLSGLPAAGYEGLALWPADLRHPFRHDRPVLKLADFRGLQFATPTSRRSFDLLEALGAKPVDFEAGVPRDVGAVEASMRSGIDNLGVTGVVTANITLYPKVYALVASSDWFHRLAADQQSVLRDAADATTTWVVQNRERESAAVTAFCRTGQAVVLADPRDLAEIVAAAGPVSADMETDPLTKRLIADFHSIRAGITEPFVVRACGSVSVASPRATIDPATIDDPSVLNGVYRADVSVAFLESRGVSSAEAANNGGILTLTFDDGTFNANLSRDDSNCGGPYVVTGSRVTVSVHDECGTWDPLFSATWTLNDDQLRFTEIEAGEPLAQALWGGKPFAWIQDVP